jgi:hypothetical protein
MQVVLTNLSQLYRKQTAQTGLFVYFNSKKTWHTPIKKAAGKPLLFGAFVKVFTTASSGRQRIEAQWLMVIDQLMSF